MLNEGDTKPRHPKSLWRTMRFRWDSFQEVCFGRNHFHVRASIAFTKYKHLKTTAHKTKRAHLLFIDVSNQNNSFIVCAPALCCLFHCSARGTWCSSGPFYFDASVASRQYTIRGGTINCALENIFVIALTGIDNGLTAYMYLHCCRRCCVAVVFWVVIFRWCVSFPPISRLVVSNLAHAHTHTHSSIRAKVKNNRFDCHNIWQAGK